MAKEQKPEQNLAETPEVPEAPKSYRLHIALAIVALILFQTIVLAAALRAWFPPPKQIDVGLTPVDRRGADIDGANPVPADLLPSEPMVEVPISEGKIFEVKEVLGDMNVTFSVSIFVKVRKKESRKFELRYEVVKSTIDDRIMSMLRGTTPEERKEVGLTAIKKRAMTIMNEILGTNYVQEVLFPKQVYEEN